MEVKIYSKLNTFIISGACTASSECASGEGCSSAGACGVCTASSECASGEGCSSAGACGMYIMYYIYDIIGTYISFNTKIYTHLKEYLILSGLCTTSVDCDGEQSCISGVCGMYIYTVDLYSYCHVTNYYYTS